MNTDQLLMCTLLLFHLKSSTFSVSARPQFPSACPNCMRISSHQIEPLKRTARLKAEILRRLGIKKAPTLAPGTPRVPETPKPREKEYAPDNVVSLSEPSDNFEDDHIIQFRLSNNTSGGKVYVKHANILVRVRYKKIRGRQKRNRSKREHQSRMISLNISTINSEGKPNTIITSVKATLKRAKWVRLTLPQEFVQNAIDSRNSTLQMYLQCHGCSKRASIILVQKKAKKPNRRRKLRLHKRRPMLFLETHVGRRKKQRRSVNADVQAIGAHAQALHSKLTSVRSKCNKIPIEIDLYELGYDWVISPSVLRTFHCVGTCIAHVHVETARANVSSVDIPNVNSRRSYVGSYPTLNKEGGADSGQINNGYSTCQPVKMASQQFVYFEDGEVKRSLLPDVIVTECGCTKASIQ